MKIESHKSSHRAIINNVDILQTVCKIHRVLSNFDLEVRLSRFYLKL